MQLIATAPSPIARSVIAIDTRGDADLAEGVRSGDASAFATLMRRHNRLLFRTARGLIGNDAEAQDVVQETWLRAFSSMHSFRGEAALGTWLARIAINVALGSRRRTGRLVPVGGAADSEFGEADSPETVMPYRTSADDWPDAIAERGEVRELLQAAIDRLPPIYRSVFMLRAVEEMSVDETASCLGVSDAVVRTRFLRARAMLRETLGTRIEGHAPQTFAFAGAHCNAVVDNVFAELRRRGLLRRH